MGLWSQLCLQVGAFVDVAGPESNLNSNHTGPAAVEACADDSGARQQIQAQFQEWPYRATRASGLSRAGPVGGKHTYGHAKSGWELFSLN